MGAKKYIYAFLISLFIVWVGVYLVNYLTEKKMRQISDIEGNIAINILSLETQFALLKDLSCSSVSESILSSELDNLARKIQYMENSAGQSNELSRLKKYYFLLEIKDFILAKQISEKCGKDLHYILYFYSNEGDCKKCKYQGRVLTSLLKKRDDLRVYSFDYNVSLSAIESLKDIFSVSDPLPALVIDGKSFSGFMDEEAIEAVLPEYKKNYDKGLKKEDGQNKDKN